MGISIEQWRASVGLFRQKLVIHHSFCKSTGCSLLKVCIISMLLLIGGIELNPGPTVAELAKKLDDFIASYQIMREQIQLSVPTLASKLDQIVKELSTVISNTDEAFKLHNLRLCALEQKLTDVVTSNQVDEHEVRNQGNSIAHSSSFIAQDTSNQYSISSIEKVVKNVLDKNKRKCNVIIFNFPDFDSFDNDKNYLSDLMYDLELDESMVESITRIGRLSSKPRPLRVQLSSEWCKNIFLDSAYKLKTMKRNWPNVGISPDRTQTELDLHRKLMQEFRLRRNQGEKIRIEDNKIVSVTGPSHISFSQRNNSLESQKKSVDHTLFSPLRVTLPQVSSLPLSSSLSFSAKEFYPSISSGEPVPGIISTELLPIASINVNK